MKAKIFIFILTTFILLSSCKKSDSEPYHPPSITSFNGSGVGAMANADGSGGDLESWARVYETGTDILIPDAYSHLIRTDNGIFGKFHSPAMNPKEVYTLWMVVFENPEYCSDGNCGSDDISDKNGQRIVNPDGSIGTPGVNVSAMWISGTISDKYGNGTIRINVEEGQSPGEVLYGPGLTDASGSEIHFIIRTHGAVLEDQIEAQLSTLKGGCNINACANQQYSIHLGSVN